MHPATCASVEDAGLNASATARQRWLDGWLLRFSPGKAKRSRCINALAAGHHAVDEKLVQCERAYAEAGLPMIVRITPLSEPAGLDAALERSGLRRFDDTRVMVLPDLPTLPAPKVGHGQIREVAGEGFAHVVGALRGSPVEQRDAHAERLGQGSSIWRGLVYEGQSETLACAQMASEGDLVGLYDVFTAPSARGRGLAGALCTELLRMAHAEGARRAYLQVEGDNHAARAIYHRLGFADAYAYHYRTRDPHAK